MIRDESGLESFTQCNGLCCDDVHQRTSLDAWENFAVDFFTELISLASKDHAAAGAAQGLVGRCRGDVGKGQGRRMETSGNYSCNMCHVDHQFGANAVGNFAETFKVDDT